MSYSAHTRTPEAGSTAYENQQAQQAENLHEKRHPASETGRASITTSTGAQLQQQYQYGYPMSYESYVNQSGDSHSQPLASAQGIMPAGQQGAYQKAQLAYPYYRSSAQVGAVQPGGSAVSTPGYSPVYYSAQGYPATGGVPAPSAQSATPEYQDSVLPSGASAGGYYQATSAYTNGGYYYGQPAPGPASAAGTAAGPGTALGAGALDPGARRAPRRSVLKPKITTTMWEDEKTLCYQVEANGVIVVRRADNDMINGTKLLNVTKMTRGRRDGILKAEKIRDVVKIGSLHLKGIWIPFERAAAMAKREGIYDLLYPLFVKDLASLIQQGTPVDAPDMMGSASSTLSYGAAGYKPLPVLPGAQEVRTPAGVQAPPQQQQSAGAQRAQQAQPQQQQTYYYYPNDLDQAYYSGPTIQRQAVQAPAQSEQHQFSQQPYFPYYSQMQYMAKPQGMEQAQPRTQPQLQPQPQPQPQAQAQAQQQQQQQQLYAQPLGQQKDRIQQEGPLVAKSDSAQK
ncbi:hypothetical protein BRETT_003820 [Brettanomyces bruxellensis]|uniref:HTH APSES-type domain-containing protein n=1 Tax=Dekkera bruxellensis TaxID=5007 RepID=A0A871R1T9_DEKBR|nr:uncharacterized protein BRETT_003820 [Brettanomyces bruxellensis]QOU19669.1 hypothetical protein BRETT_003820 [Brettanomyces bruxellensis]